MIGSCTIRGDRTYSLIGGEHSIERIVMESDMRGESVDIFRDGVM
jgi:hypothetical protein